MSGKALAAVKKRNGTAASALPLRSTKQCLERQTQTSKVVHKKMAALSGRHSVLRL
ncbi:hypothetical protein MFFC18_19970 [Mariniblastus fucicola]|uniref:Uncharacterized protein n=1 Tax=Mariniblastus fucicola TaxID=980251 RepID=A0A5B9PC96_9BACT|nr:hypothetical protein MFFC18_19970 [Mariniblastus fucicola]